MDRTWKLKGKGLDERKIIAAGIAIAANYDGVRVEVEREDPEFITLFFTVPTQHETDKNADVEITIYDMGKDGIVLSLEADAADNNAVWDDASQLAEDLADTFEGAPLDM
jgi:hypothetical protein